MMIKWRQLHIITYKGTSFFNAFFQFHLVFFHTQMYQDVYPCMHGQFDSHMSYVMLIPFGRSCSGQKRTHGNSTLTLQPCAASSFSISLLSIASGQMPTACHRSHNSFSLGVTRLVEPVHLGTPRSGMESLSISSRAFSNDSGSKSWDPHQTLVTYGMKRFKTSTALSNYPFRIL